ncbi:MAG: DUF3737 family protein [Anaeroplasma sp.]
MEVIENKTYDEERALYNLKNTNVIKCTFAGEKDGESVLKESRNIIVENCSFSLRYPLWHTIKFQLNNSKLDELTRAPIWYSVDGYINNTEIKSVKAVRECQNIIIKASYIDSKEFGWKCNNIDIYDSQINSEYIFFDSKNINLHNIKFSGKYSFQYMENLLIEDSILDTKDAFWHSKNVIVKNSIVKGEYLAWFSDGLTLINCKIIGTQPLCYCKSLKLIDCEMIDTDLAFEYSEVDATIKGNVMSIKNPKVGKIVLDSVGDIIKENSIMEDNCIIEIRTGN